tara:strand:+ start:268 stop:393 length:126 start_codon:yes stop_codon:yes gene_type:complete
MSVRKMIPKLPWWFETKIHGSSGKFSAPFIVQETPQINFNE